jgi:hypothetical protein
VGGFFHSHLFTNFDSGKENPGDGRKRAFLAATRGARDGSWVGFFIRICSQILTADANTQAAEGLRETPGTDPGWIFSFAFVHKF